MDPSGSAVTFSPDGSRIAFVSNSKRLKQSKLFIADRDARDARVLAAREDPSYFCDFLTAPAWSPDGKIIASPAGSPDPSGLLRYIVGVRTTDGVEVPIGSRRWYDVQRVVWMRDGAGLVATASDRIASPHQLWFVGYPDGTARRITNDQDDYYGVSATADSTALVTVQTDRVANLWVVPDSDARRALEITSEAHKTSAMEGLAWTPDGRIVYRSSAGGAQDIWITKPDGTGGLQLTTGAGNNLHPAVCGDGRYVVFVSDRAGSLNVWRMDLDGRNPKRLTTGANEMFPTCSPDGKWVVYQRGYGYDLVHNLYRVPIEGGEPAQLTHRTSRAPVFSPDGNRIAFFELTEQGWGFTVLRADTGAPLHGFQILPSVLSRAIRWTPDGRGLAYAVTSAGIGNVWVQPLDGGSPRQLTDFRSGLLFDFAWSPDGRTLACLRGTQTSDVVLVKDLGR
jgi:Tol biopolymer transport system component